MDSRFSSGLLVVVPQLSLEQPAALLVMLLEVAARVTLLHRLLALDRALPVAPV